MMGIWEQQEKEPDEWYARFRAYLTLGPQRTVAAAHIFALHLTAQPANHFADQAGDQSGNETTCDAAETTPLGSVRVWQRRAQQYEWKERALAFDAEQEHQALVGDERLRMVAALLRQVYDALCHADIPALSKEEVRLLLPTFRLFFHDLLKFHQSATAQLLAGKGIGPEGEGSRPISADGFSAIMKDDETVRQIHELAAQVAAQAGERAHYENGWQPLRDLLSQLYADEASARRIAAQAQLDVARIAFSGSALDRWQAILTEAVHAGAMRKLIDVVRKEYGGNEELAEVLRAYEAWRAWGAIEKRRRRGEK